MPSPYHDNIVHPYDHLSFSQTSNKTFVTEESSLVLETLEEGRHHHYLIPIQVVSSFIMSFRIMFKLLSLMFSFYSNVFLTLYKDSCR